MTNLLCPMKNKLCDRVFDCKEPCQNKTGKPIKNDRGDYNGKK